MKGATRRTRDTTRRADTFTKFGSLPPELRIEIWRLCLPHRIIEMHDIRSRRTASACWPPRAVRTPPLISRVCRESRTIALQNGSLQPMMGSGAPVWYDRKTDIINIGRVYSFESNLVAEESVEKVDSLRSGFKDFICRPVTRISVAKDAIFYCPDSAFARWVVRRMAERLVSCSIVVADMSIHLPREAAAASELFGLFAESTTVHVDMQDTKWFEALFALKKMFKQPKGRGTPVTDSLVQGRTYQYMRRRHGVPEFLHCVKAIWLKENGALPADVESWKLFPTLEKYEGIRQVLALLPEFEFAIAVHLCTNPHHNSTTKKPSD
ncbi:hypothetical protein GGR57DRAFT_230423 [Xylariaceae sp. FL1272]|nr:hypothetical protein GGR57DRAFT_230423 [Xylariaceae sp. FL1272]